MQKPLRTAPQTKDLAARRETIRWPPACKQHDLGTLSAQNCFRDAGQRPCSTTVCYTEKDSRDDTARKGVSMQCNQRLDSSATQTSAGSINRPALPIVPHHLQCWFVRWTMQLAHVAYLLCPHRAAYAPLLVSAAAMDVVIGEEDGALAHVHVALHLYACSCGTISRNVDWGNTYSITHVYMRYSMISSAHSLLSYMPIPRAIAVIFFGHRHGCFASQRRLVSNRTRSS